MTFFLLLINLVFAQGQNACSQHNPMSPDVPACPTTGSTLLSENYPIMAATVSDYEGGPEWVKSYVTKVMKAQPQKPPQFFLHVTSETYESVVAELRKQAPSPQVADQWIKGLTRVEGNNRWNWQQDYFDNFYNPKTGQPVLREVQGYGRHGDSYTSMINSTAKECNIHAGVLLENTQYKSGHSGGNIEAVNGLCLLGADHFTNNEWDSYAKSTCTNMEAAVKTPSDFLKVGHTDEMFKTLKDPSQKPPCDFALAFASPKKGLEVLKGNPDGKVFDFPGVSGEELLTRVRQSGYREICAAYTASKRSQNLPPSPGKTRSGKGVSQLLWELSITKSFAGVLSLTDPRVESLYKELQALDDMEPKSAEERQRLVTRKSEILNKIKRQMKKAGYLKSNAKMEEAKECLQMTNKDLAKIIESDKEFKDFNESVEKAIQQFKKDLLAKLKQKYPQCSPKTLDIPDIYQGMMDYDKQPASYAMGTGLSLFPNPTNGEIVGNTYIMPDPVNPAFKADIDKQIKGLGLKTDYIDTHFAHVQQGNLHCSSHAIRYCRPQGGKK
ncbi:protein-arginine deiminase family protein [Bdellovibrio sp. HCB-162]|uniref:protein-arginine deiminase family protein n=1 Tax=Bdellovibrio sp. HCB-162 TaxID=3394234 RepID=UPI0039BD46C9